MKHRIIEIIKKIRDIKASVLDLHIPPFLFPTACKYHPSCSDYTIEAIKKYGIIRGGYYGALRITRCTIGVKPKADILN